MPRPFQDVNEEKPNYRLAIWIIVAIIVAIALMLLSPFAIVGTGQRGVVTHLGAVSGDILGEGFHWKTPLVESVVSMDVQTQKETVDVSAATNDLQDVTSSVAINYHLDPSKAATMYQTVGQDYSGVLIAPRLQEQVKAATAKYNAEELITKRSQVSDDIVAGLKDALSPYGIVVDGFNIVNFSFSQQFSTAIEAAATAKQDAIAAQNKLVQVQAEADQRVATAKGEAEAISIQAAAINSQGGADYVALQAISKWNGQLPTQYIPGSSLPFINAGVSK